MGRHHHRISICKHLSISVALTFHSGIHRQLLHGVRSLSCHLLVELNTIDHAGLDDQNRQRTI